MKKIITLLLTIFLTLLMPSNVFADEEKIYMDGYLFYTISNDEITIIKYVGNEDSVKVPMTIGDYEVTGIGDDAFVEKEVKEVLLPDTITHVSETAFEKERNVDIKYFDKNDNLIEKEDVVSDEPTLDDDKTQQDDKEIQEVIISDGDTQQPQSNNNVQHITTNNEDDSSTHVNVGDTIEEHDDMVSEIHVSLEDIVEKDNEVSDSPIIEEGENINNEGTNSVIYITISACIIAIVIFCIKKKS